MRAVVHPDGRLVLAGHGLRAPLGCGGARCDEQKEQVLGQWGGAGAGPVGRLPVRWLLYRADCLDVEQGLRSAALLADLQGRAVHAARRISACPLASARTAVGGEIIAARRLSRRAGSYAEIDAHPNTDLARQRALDHEVTGLRNPCVQLDTFQPGIIVAVLDRDEYGHLIRKVGIMGVVLTDGEVHAGDPITVELPIGHHEKLDRV